MTLIIKQKSFKVLFSTDLEYDTDATFASLKTGDGVSLERVIPGETYYFRKIGLKGQYKSKITSLQVRTRIEAPTDYTIDYANEHTAEVIEETIEYSFDSIVF